jgi:peptide/nickel transport system permease protein
MIYESSGFVLQDILKDVTSPEERDRITEEVIWGMEEAYGLHQPFLLRSLHWLYNGMTLGMGEARDTTGRGFGSVRAVRPLILERLPYTLILFGAANLFLFFTSVALALSFARNQGGWMDRINVILSSLTSAPSWIYGVILIVFFAGTLRILPYPQSIELENVRFTTDNLIFLSRMMVLPFAAIVLSMFFQSIYAWRTFFLVHTDEEYVDLARAKGLSSKALNRKYILRPALPYILTSFTLMLIGIWQGSIALEVLFEWPGIGVLFLGATRSFQTPLLIGIVVIFAYLLAISVFVLDIVYALVDPRISVGSGEKPRRLYGIRAKRKYWPWSVRAESNFGVKARRTPTGIQDIPEVKAKVSLTGWISAVWNGIKGPESSLSELFKYKGAVIALIIIAVMVGVSIYTLFAYPYEETVMTWRGQGNEEYRGLWYENPKYALPAWVNYFRRDRLPETIILNSQKGTAGKNIQEITEEMSEVQITFPISYTYSEFPQELVLYLDANFDEKRPLIVFTWVTPDGREIEFGDFSITSTHTYYPFRDEKLQRRLKDQPVLEAFFADPAEGEPVPLQGDYELRVSGFFFEEGSDLDVELVLHGKVFGLAGTDHNRRDLKLALLWGMPLALAFGLFGAVITNLVAMLIAAGSVWLGGWVDDLTQRITEVNLILPVLPIAIMIYTLYSKSIWVILCVVVLLNIFGSAIKNYRAAFLQIKSAGYIEAAQAYGASQWRIVRHYLVPRILPILVPQMIIMVPTYVFFEATLAYLGVSDPYLPTWGKVIYDAIETGGIRQGYFHLILQPIALMMVAGLAFAMLGIALDRILNPRLRES